MDKKDNKPFRPSAERPRPLRRSCPDAPEAAFAVGAGTKASPGPDAGTPPGYTRRSLYTWSPNCISAQEWATQNLYENKVWVLFTRTMPINVHTLLATLEGHTTNLEEEMSPSSVSGIAPCSASNCSEALQLKPRFPDPPKNVSTGELTLWRLQELSANVVLKMDSCDHVAENQIWEGQQGASSNTAKATRQNKFCKIQTPHQQEW